MVDFYYSNYNKMRDFCETIDVYSLKRQIWIASSICTITVGIYDSSYDTLFFEKPSALYNDLNYIINYCNHKKILIRYVHIKNKLNIINIQIH